MVFYTVFMGIIDLSVSWMLIGRDLRRIEGLSRGTVCLLEGIYSHGRVRNRVEYEYRAMTQSVCYVASSTLDGSRH